MKALSHLLLIVGLFFVFPDCHARTTFNSSFTGRKSTDTATVKPNLDDLAAFLAHNIRYPLSAVNDNISGNLVFEITINDKSRVSNYKILQEFSRAKECIQEITTYLSVYRKTVNAPPGKYKMLFQFIIYDGDSTYHESQFANANCKDCISTVVITINRY